MKDLDIKMKLEKLDGLSNVHLLSEEQKNRILEIEEVRNKGVIECAKREKCFVVVHDSTFREPDSEIVVEKDDNVEFPVVGFHEIVNSISSSPSLKVHEFLVKEFKMELNDEATLLIGI
jgi:hypothetical protein